MIPRLTSDGSLLLVVDVQARLLPAMHDAARVERNIAALCQVARRLQIPVVVTEQNPAKIGGTVESIRAALGEFEPLEKLRFSSFPVAKSQIEATNRKTVLLCGLESHVCVTQTALDLLESGFFVFVAGDAISSRSQFNHQIGWKRMTFAGAIPTSVESAIFEWLGEAGTDDFRAILPWIK
jgi:nicotinamidase-related amidase